MNGKLYLIPTTLGDFDSIQNTLPSFNQEITHRLRHFVVEHVRTARRFLSKTRHPDLIESLTFYELGKHTPPIQIASYLDVVMQGQDMGLLSEAGTPCVADPGASIVQLAHEKGIEVIPLVGPNSIILALMASGFNGQNFAFHGYLPVDKSDLSRKIKDIEAATRNHNQTQIFIETPFRNKQFLSTLISTCSQSMRLCVAINLTLPEQKIISKTIKEWKKTQIDIHKKPAVFLLYK